MRRVVSDARARLRVINPEARRLLMLDPSWLPEEGMALPAVIDRLLADSSSKSPAAEREWSFDDPAGTRYLGITQAHVTGKDSADKETIWILRDITEEKRMFAERETARRNQSLAEIATVLAHEIRNPLGSLELFAGLLADTTRSLPKPGSGWDRSRRGCARLPPRSTTFFNFIASPARSRSPRRSTAC